MAQPVTAILAFQNELSERARAFTDGANEAGLLVGKVVSRAFAKFEDGADAAALAQAMRRDLDRLIEETRRRRIS